MPTCPSRWGSADSPLCFPSRPVPGGRAAPRMASNFPGAAPRAAAALARHLPFLLEAQVVAALS